MTHAASGSHLGRTDRVVAPIRGHPGHRHRPTPDLLIGAAAIGLIAVAAVLAPALTPYDPVATDPSRAYLPPGPRHPFGTDRFGMDIFSRVLYGARVDLWIVGASGVSAALVGISVGALAGYRGGAIDWWTMRSLELLQAFPSLILAIAVIAALGQDTGNVILVVAAIGVPYYARLVRAEVRLRRAWPFVEAARAAGGGHARILLRHLLPNCLGAAIAYSAVHAAWALLVASGLGFLGLGVRIPTPEWGLMVSMGLTNMITGEWWVAFFPGAAIVVLSAGLHLLADGLHDWLDPRRRR